MGAVLPVAGAVPDVLQRGVMLRPARGRPGRLTDEREGREGLRQSTVGWTRHAFRPPPLPRQPFRPLSSDLHA